MGARKGVILSGGKGTRLLPLTHVTSKQLLPVYDKPMIYYPLSTLMMAGIREIMIISSSYDLYRFQALFEDGSHLGIKITYGVQEIPRGIADAFLVAEAFIGQDPVALILGDNIFCGSQIEEAILPENIVEEGATIFAYEVSHPEKYGVLKFNEEERVVDLVEKPVHPPSSFAVPGLYFYDSSVMEKAKQLSFSDRGELEITDVNRAFIRRGKMNVVKLGRGSAWFDAGSFEDLHKASTYIQIIQRMHNIKIGCIEEIAFLKRFIDQNQLEVLAKNHEGSEYGAYLYSLKRDLL